MKTGKVNEHESLSDADSVKTVLNENLVYFCKICGTQHNVAHFSNGKPFLSIFCPNEGCENSRTYQQLHKETYF